MDEEQKKKRVDELTDMQKKVTQDHGTEMPYSGDHHDRKENGIYKCVVCGEELFASDEKFDSGTGWPSFFNKKGSIKEEDDDSLGMRRTEVSCDKCGAHLGHLFNDAPQTPTGNRYCINSASLDFEEKEENE